MIKHTLITLCITTLLGCSYDSEKDKSPLSGKWVNTQFTDNFVTIQWDEDHAYVKLADGSEEFLQWSLQDDKLQLTYGETTSSYEIIEQTKDKLVVQKEDKPFTLLPYGSFTTFGDPSDITFHIVNQLWHIERNERSNKCFADFAFPNVLFQTCSNEGEIATSHKFSWKLITIDSLAILQLDAVLLTNVFVDQVTDERITGFYYDSQFGELQLLKTEEPSNADIVRNLSATWALNTEIAPYLEAKVPSELALSSDESDQMYSVEFSNDHIQFGDWSVGQSGHILVLDVDSKSKLLWFEIQDLSNDLLRLRIDGNAIEYRKVER